MKYWSDKHFIYISGNTYPRREFIKETLSGVYFDNKKGKGYRFPKNVFAYRELAKAFPELLQNKEFVDDGKLAGSDIKYWLRMKTDFMESLAYDKRLRPYQNNDVHYLTKRGSALVLNEPRTGKTPTMISVIKALKTKDNLVVCPSSLVLNWAKEFAIWYPQCQVVAIAGDKKKRGKQINHYIFEKLKGKTQVLIISKDTLKIEVNGQLEDSKFDSMIVDEAHFLRNYKSKQSQAISSVYAKYKYALTGTPSVKHGSDVFGLLNFINPHAFPSYWQFTDRYWNIIDNGWGKDLGGTKGWREKELLDLMAMNSVQRKRKDVMKWLPEQTRQTISVEMGKKQLKLYDQMFDTFMATDGKDDTLHEVDTINKLSQLMRLRQLCVDPRLLGFDVVGAKTTALLEFSESMAEPFVVMTMFSSYFKIIKPELEKLGKRVAIIDGTVTKSNRNKIVEQFQRGEVDVLLANIIAAGTGLTLDRSDTIVFLDKAFNPADNEQAEDRIVPTTKERYHSINIISLVVDGTVDERINEILERKEDVTKLINKPEVFI